MKQLLDLLLSSVYRAVDLFLKGVHGNPSTLHCSSSVVSSLVQLRLAVVAIAELLAKDAEIEDLSKDSVCALKQVLAVDLAQLGHAIVILLIVGPFLVDV